GLALEQDAARLAPRDEDVVRPFVAELDERRHEGADRLAERESGDEAELPVARGLRLRTEHEGKEEIARRRHPGPAAPAAPGALLAGPDERPLLRAFARPALRLLVGAVDPIEGDETVGGRKDHPGKSEAAAAAAPSTTSEGAMKKKSVTTAVTASTAFISTPKGLSNAGSGASKYMSLTMRM